MPTVAAAQTRETMSQDADFVQDLRLVYHECGRLALATGSACAKKLAACC